MIQILQMMPDACWNPAAFEECCVDFLPAQQLRCGETFFARYELDLPTDLSYGNGRFHPDRCHRLGLGSDVGRVELAGVLDDNVGDLDSPHLHCGQGGKLGHAALLDQVLLVAIFASLQGCSRWLLLPVHLSFHDFLISFCRHLILPTAAPAWSARGTKGLPLPF